MAYSRILIAAADERLRHHAQALFEALGGSVRTADSGIDCLGQLRAAVPDLLVLIPPLLWGAEDAVLEVVREDPSTRRLPVLLLAPPGPGGPDGPTVRLFLGGSPATRASLDRLAGLLARRLRASGWEATAAV